MRKNKGFNKLEEAILKMRNKRSITTDMTWDEYGNPKPSINGRDNMNNNPGNTDNNLNMTVLREYITMYLDDIESYGTEEVLNEATDVLFDFVKYINAMGESEDEQAMIDYNAMEEEWEMDNYNKMKDEQIKINIDRQ